MSRAPRRVRQLVAVVGAAAIAGLTMSACAPTHAGAAAVVNGHRISDNQVREAAQHRLDDENTKDLASKDQGLKREVLTGLINDQLLANAAKAKGVTVSEGDVQSLIQQDGGSTAILNALAAQGQPIAATDLHDTAYYALLKQDLAKALTAGQKYTTVDLHVIVTVDKATADNVLAQVKADPTQFAALASKYSQDASASNGGDIGTLLIDQLPEPIRGDLAGKAVGDIFEDQVQSQPVVIQVAALDSVGVDELDAQTAQTVQQQAVESYLASSAKNVSISVSPRYGQWNPSTGSVVASTGALSSAVPTQGSAPSAPPSAPPSPAAG